VPEPMNPQTLNRYSYCLNNPLKYVDPTGHQIDYGEFPFPMDWLQDPGAWLLLTPEELAAIAWYLNPPPLEGDLLPASDSAEPVDEPSVPEWDNSGVEAGVVIVAAIAADDITGVGIVDDVVIPIVVIGAGIYTIADNWDVICYNVSNWWNGLFKSEQDKKLTKDEVRRLERGTGETAEEIKGKKHAGSRELYKDKHGNVIVKPKGGKGPGEPTGYNINDY
jgi:hypothetical protein